MTDPVFDARAEHPGEPGVHALIVGISEYANLPGIGEQLTEDQERYGLGLRRLTSAASSGYLVYQWLREAGDRLPSPLLTCRLLLAPTAEEVAAVDGLGADAYDATLKSVLAAAKAWRKDVASHREGTAFFYFAGHGLQRKRGDHVLVLEDVGDGLGQRLQNAIDTFTLVQGMAPSKEHPEMARHQLYFFDACQMPPVDAWKYEDEKCTGVFDTPVIDRDDRAAPEYYTALPGMTAFALKGEQTVFSKALLRCLGGAAGEKRDQRWCVTLHSLNEGLRHHLAEIAAKGAKEQMFRLDGLTENLVVCWLAEPPDVELEVELVPGDAAEHAELTVDDFKNPVRTFGPPLDPHPYTASVKAGSYKVTVQPGGGAGPLQELREANPPRDRWELAV